MSTSEQVSIPLASKPRYEILDGLRGVAAMIVVLYHILETYAHNPLDHPLNHGYLGVDFFFVLSGFVIGYAYDDRWGRMTMWNFFKRRIVRLHPLVILGTTFGLLMFFFTDSPMFPLMGEVSLGHVLLMFVLACLMIPALPSWDIRGWAETNAFDNPTWSLTYEYIANILYAVFIRHLGTKVLAALVALFALLTVNLAMDINVCGLLGERAQTACTVIGGWSITPDQVMIGFSRLLYPFFAGLLLSRIGKHIKVRGGFWVCALLVAAAQWMPRLGGESGMWMNGLYESFAILLLFPLIVSMGAGSVVEGKMSAAVCKFLGDISYPLYIMHYPFIDMQMTWAHAHPDAPFEVHVFVGVSVFLLAIGTSYAALKVFDIPVREWLQKKWLRSRKSKS